MMENNTVSIDKNDTLASDDAGKEYETSVQVIQLNDIRVRRANPQEKFYEYLEDEIEELIGKLKPKLLEKAVFSSSRNGDRRAGAITNQLTNPPKIEICVNSLEETYRSKLVESLKILITHEIIHCIQPQITLNTLNASEKEAYIKSQVLKFFQE